jgi:4-hydroxy-3-methylbut-2-enyl diphosphate reductase IspH
MLEMMAQMNAKMDSNQHEMKVQIGGLASRMDVDKEEMKATIRNGQEEMIKAITGVSQESTETCEEKTKALPETCPEVTPVWRKRGNQLQKRQRWWRIGRKSTREQSRTELANSVWS